MSQKRKHVEAFGMEANPYQVHKQLMPARRYAAVQTLSTYIDDTDAARLERNIYVMAARDVIIYKRELARMVYNISMNKDYLCATYDMGTLVCIKDSLLSRGTKAEKREVEAQKRLQLVQKFIVDEQGQLERKAMKEKIGGLDASVCPKCHKDDKVTTKREQKRAADEGMTDMAYCSRCNKVFQPRM